MINRDFFWIDTDKTLRLPRRIGLDGFGLMVEICSRFYCGEPVVDDETAAPSVLRCTGEEWLRIRGRLLEEHEIEIRDGFVVPVGDWHKPVVDS